MCQAIVPQFISDGVSGSVEYNVALETEVIL